MSGSWKSFQVVLDIKEVLKYYRVAFTLVKAKKEGKKKTKHFNELAGILIHLY